MNLRAAAQQALEAFEWNYNTDLDNILACERWAKMLKENITALKQALAEPETVMHQYKYQAYGYYKEDGKLKLGTIPEPQTTHWEGCEEVHPECRKPEPPCKTGTSCTNKCPRCAEPEQPVAWVEPKWLDPDTRGWPSDSFASQPIEGWLPLYTAPTPRQWVSLTDQEMYDLFFNDQYGPRLPEYLVNTIKCVEAALKEKNNG